MTVLAMLYSSFLHTMDNVTRGMKKKRNRREKEMKELFLLEKEKREREGKATEALISMVANQKSIKQKRNREISYEKFQ